MSDVTKPAHSILYEPVNAVWEPIASATGLAKRIPEIPDHVVMAFFVVALVALIAVPMSRRLRRKNPGWAQQIAELLVGGLSNILEDTIGPGGGRRFLPLVGGLTLFIFLSNFLGQFFFFQPPTQNVNTTFTLSILAFFFYHAMGLRKHGLGYFKQFLGPGPPPWWMWPLMLPLEIISHCARALSLGVRLFGNVFGEHIAAGIFFSMVPFLVPLPLMALGLLAAVLQTFIFIMLTTVYIAGAEAEEH